MTRGEVLRLARKAGLRVEAANIGPGIMVTPSPPMALELFVHLIETAECEACAQMCESVQLGGDDDAFGLLKACAEAIRNRKDIKK